MSITPTDPILAHASQETPNDTATTTSTSAGGSPDIERRDPVPLCVDLDGTLLRTDLLWEALFAVLGEKPGLILKLPGWLAQGKATLKHHIASHVVPDAAYLPYRQDVLEFLQQQKAAGRTLVLATASHQHYADAVASHLDGLFDHAIGSNDTQNRRGLVKIQAVREAVGETFDYMGDSDADLPLLDVCRYFYLVDPSRRLRETAAASDKVRHTFEDGPTVTALHSATIAGKAPATGWRAMVKLIRPHQWAKNLLLLVPMIMAHQLDAATLGWALLGIAAFCCSASSIYIFNDLVDIDSDRRHKSKRRRPLAAATVSVPTALKLGICLLLGGLAAACLAALGPGGWAFPAWVLLYLLLTTVYSFSLKRRLLIDVILLGWLYTHRVLAGGIVTDIVVSQWLLAFSTFLFISLAFAKRYTELHHAPPGKNNARRGYLPEDLPLIGNIGPTSGFMALLVFCLYLNDLQAGGDPLQQGLYETPWLLWLVVPVMMFWILRVWFLAFRGELDDDPIVFAIRDRVSYACFVAAAALLVLASI